MLCNLISYEICNNDYKGHINMGLKSESDFHFMKYGFDL